MLLLTSCTSLLKTNSGYWTLSVHVPSPNYCELSIVGVDGQTGDFFDPYYNTLIYRSIYLPSADLTDTSFEHLLDEIILDPENASITMRYDKNGEQKVVTWMYSDRESPDNVFNPNYWQHDIWINKPFVYYTGYVLYPPDVSVLP